MLLLSAAHFTSFISHYLQSSSTIQGISILEDAKLILRRKKRCKYCQGATWQGQIRSHESWERVSNWAILGSPCRGFQATAEMRPISPRHHFYLKAHRNKKNIIFILKSMYCFETFFKKCYHVTQADLKLTILLPQPLGTGITDI